MADRLTGLAAAEPYKSVARPALLVELRFGSGTVWVWSGIGPLTWNGATWLGVGWLGRVSAVEETLELKAAGASFQLSGVPSELLIPVVSESIQSRQALMYLAFFDEDWTVVPDPVLLFRGRMDTIEIADGGAIATITLYVESRLRDLERARVRRYTDADQQAEYPNDLGLSFVAALQEINILWGRAL
ncbi:MAG: hypothetical protein WCK65_09810 [Rhodospirillaceae bacterium]